MTDIAMPRRATLGDLELVRAHAVTPHTEPPFVILSLGHLKPAEAERGDAEREMVFLVPPFLAEEIGLQLLQCARQATGQPLDG